MNRTQDLGYPRDVGQLLRETLGERYNSGVLKVWYRYTFLELHEAVSSRTFVQRH